MSVSKAEAIIRCLTEENIDLWTLRELALTEGGLLNNFIRRRAWPRLLSLDRCSDDALNVDEDDPSKKGEGEDITTHSHTMGELNSSRLFLPFEPEKEYDFSNLTEAEIDQVQRDVVRCTWHLLTRDQKLIWDRLGNRCFDDEDDEDQEDAVDHSSSFSGEDGRSLERDDKSSIQEQKKLMHQLKRQQKKLGHLIKMILQDATGSLKYYQGFHDVSSIFLSVLEADGLSITKRVLFRLSKSHFRDQMNDTFHEISCSLRVIIFPLLDLIDKPLHDYLQSAGMIEPFFALSWILTWFSHDLKDTKVATRLFDAFLVSHPVLPFYITLATITHPINRQAILKTECDFSELHTVLRNLPKNISSTGRRCVAFSTRSEEEKENHRTTSQKAKRHNTNISLVPVQDLIDMAIGYMRRVPPRSIINVAKKYSSRNENSLEPFLGSVDNITFFQDPPSWALVARVPSDWILAHNTAATATTTTRTKSNQPKSFRIPTNGEKVSGDNHKCKGLILLDIIEKDGDVDMSRESLNNNNHNARTASGIMGDLTTKRVKVAKIFVFGGIAVVALYCLSTYYYRDSSYFLPRKDSSTCQLAPDDDASCRAEKSSTKVLKWLPRKTLLLPDSSRSSNKSNLTPVSCPTDSKPKNAIIADGQNESSCLWWSGTVSRSPGSYPDQEAKSITAVERQNLPPPSSHVKLIRKVVVSPLKFLMKLRPRLTWFQSTIQAGMQNMEQILQKEFSSHNQSIITALD